MTKAVYTLDRDQKRKIFEWIKALRFPDGYTSNLGRCIDLNELKLNGMKSHDCHVFMERLIPTTFREMLSEFVWNALTEVSLLFQVISSATLDINKVKELEESVAIIVCNLEKIFPPAFFDSMVHLLVHLPYEARVGGPVQYRWMYPFERAFCKIYMSGTMLIQLTLWHSCNAIASMVQNLYMVRGGSRGGRGHRVAPSSTPPPIPPSPIVRETLSSSPTLPPSHVGIGNTHVAPSPLPSPAVSSSATPPPPPPPPSTSIPEAASNNVPSITTQSNFITPKDSDVMTVIKPIITGYYLGPWPCFKDVPQETKDFWFRKFSEGLLGCPPSLIEQLEKCWKTKQGNWAGPRAEEVVENFKKLNDDVTSQHLPESPSSTSVNDQQLWLEAIGGVKKGRIWGMGSETRLSTSRTSTTTNTVNPMPEQGESELVQKLLLENKTMPQEIKHTQKEMQMLKMQFANKFGTVLEDVNESEDGSSDNDPPSSNHL
ncbi:UNVERIFIED_CONTAM: hypothetical protein Scaly_2926700 [Sesamum calycinum]|uniref:DUF4218 domain-containing protein n=1 Tax=Sesamum calycinum TaxID=2727403 RepID=A0AAW2KTX4_9LAMI